MTRSIARTTTASILALALGFFLLAATADAKAPRLTNPAAYRAAASLVSDESVAKSEFQGFVDSGGQPAQIRDAAGYAQCVTERLGRSAAIVRAVFVAVDKAGTLYTKPVEVLVRKRRSDVIVSVF